MIHGGAESDPLRPHLSAVRARPGQCPSAEVLVSFASDSLPVEQTEAIRSHLNGCGLCDSLVERIRQFDAEEAPSLVPVPDEQRLRSKVFPKPRWRMILLHPATAYAAALVAMLFAILPARREKSSIPTPVPTTSLASVRILDLNLTRGTQEHRFALGPADRFLLFAFLIDIRPAFHYAASLDGGTSREISSTDGKGNFALLYSRDLLGKGSHRLTVTETNPQSSKTERSFEFTFEL